MLEFLAKVVLISSTGALTPGPLTAATAAIGVKRGWKGGFLVSTGHMAFEFPLVVAIGLGVATLFTSEIFVRVVSFIGGVFMLLFAYLTFRDAIKAKTTTISNPTSSPVLVGIGLSALNPFFIAWWIGVGTPLILEALRYWGLVGIPLFYVAHVWLDFAWLSIVAHVTSLTGVKLKLYKLVLLIVAVFVLLFGVDFLYYAIFKSHLMPF